MPSIAVLTGDVIGSTKLKPGVLPELREAVVTVANRFARDHPDAMLGQPDFFRGDAWQIVLAQPGLALRLSLTIRACLRYQLKVDTRVSIGVGAGEVNLDQVSLSTGEAFVLSGRGLDGMTSYFELQGTLPERVGLAAPWFRSLVELTSGLARRWKPGQAEVLMTALQLADPKHEAIARLLTPPRTKATVTGSLLGANWRPIRNTLLVLEATDWSRILNEGLDG
jgi:hypothetical protein